MQFYQDMSKMLARLTEKMKGYYANVYGLRIQSISMGKAIRNYHE